MVDLNQLIKLIPDDLKWLVVLVLVLVTLHKKMWVIGWMYEAKCIEAEYYKEKADRAAETGKAIGHAASEIAGLAKEAVAKR